MKITLSRLQRARKEEAMLTRFRKHSPSPLEPTHRQLCLACLTKLSHCTHLPLRKNLTTYVVPQYLVRHSSSQVHGLG